MLTVTLIVRLTSVSKFIYLKDITIIKFIKNSQCMISNRGDYKFIKEYQDLNTLQEFANAIEEWMNPYEYRALIKDHTTNKTHSHGFYTPPSALWKECETEKFNIYR